MSVPTGKKQAFINYKPPSSLDLGFAMPAKGGAEELSQPVNDKRTIEPKEAEKA
jgi:hypothetical protein